MSARSRKLAEAFGTEAFGRAVDSLYNSSIRDSAREEVQAHLFGRRKFI